MAKTVYRYLCGKKNEVVIAFRGERGALHDRCGPKRKRTQAEIARQNLINKTNRIRKILLLNFKEDDYWMDLTVKKENRRPP